MIISRKIQELATISYPSSDGPDHIHYHDAVRRLEPE
jgi:hypothetical protein